MYLDLLNSHWFPTWPTVFAMAKRVLSTVKQADPDFYNHLKMISRINVKVNPKVRFIYIVFFFGYIMDSKVIYIWIHYIWIHYIWIHFGE